jgi:hypothetical protein
MPTVTEERFKGLLAPLFPKEVDFRHVYTSDRVRFDVSWKLTSDPNRPNKRSRKIIVIVSEETLEDYEDGDDAARRRIEKKMVGDITKRLREFNPEHNTPYGQLEPEEQWVI